VLNRLLCILLPFEELRTGKSRPYKSIDAKYTSMPPQLTILRALKARHFLLTVVCFIALLANVLAVSLSGLLDEASTFKHRMLSSTYRHSSVFSGSSIVSFIPQITYADHFYVALANLSSGTTLPPWIGQDVYFTPFQITDDISSSAGRYEGSTRAFGSAVTCQVTTAETPNNRVVFSADVDAIQFYVIHTTEDNRELTCVTYAQGNGRNETSIFQVAPNTNSQALEVVTSMALLGAGGGNISTDMRLCHNLLVTGWVRLGAASASDNMTSENATLANRLLESSWLTCKPTLQTALFNVTVDAVGTILNAVQDSPFETDLTPYFEGNASITNSTLKLFFEAMDLIAPPSNDFSWHNETITSDWMTSLLKYSMNSTELFDPSQPVPNAAAMAPIVENLYQQLFAILLGLNSHVFASADPSLTSSSTKITSTHPETRIFMSELMFCISISILMLNFVVAIAYYTLRPANFLPVMPTTIASIISFVIGSQALEEYGQGMMSEERKDLRFGYGRYMGIDGAPRVGIERYPYVVPLEGYGAQVRKRTWGVARRQTELKEVKVWM
jgi:hypothetical protein